MDRITAAVVAGDTDAMERCYAENAVAQTPDLGTITGRAEVVKYVNGFSTAFPDAHFELIGMHEAGDVAVDEGYFLGTHTGPLELPDGQTVEPTGKEMRIRECDVVVVADGQIVEHRFYYDQMEFALQLGLIEQQPTRTTA
jgi:ketosteroid isomerase-like protein